MPLLQNESDIRWYNALLSFTRAVATPNGVPLTNPYLRIDGHAIINQPPEIQDKHITQDAQTYLRFNQLGNAIETLHQLLHQDHLDFEALTTDPAQENLQALKTFFKDITECKISFTTMHTPVYFNNSHNIGLASGLYDYNHFIAFRRTCANYQEPHLQEWRENTLQQLHDNNITPVYFIFDAIQQFAQTMQLSSIENITSSELEIIVNLPTLDNQIQTLRAQPEFIVEHDLQDDQADDDEDQENEEDINLEMQAALRRIAEAHQQEWQALKHKTVFVTIPQVIGHSVWQKQGYSVMNQMLGSWAATDIFNSVTMRSLWRVAGIGIFGSPDQRTQAIAIYGMVFSVATLYQMYTLEEPLPNSQFCLDLAEQFAINAQHCTTALTASDHALQNLNLYGLVEQGSVLAAPLLPMLRNLWRRPEPQAEQERERNEHRHDN